MGLIEALLLGAVQGLTEYLPVSSSGHLVLVPFLLGWPPHGQRFDLALHVGTAASLLWFFRRDWLALARAVVGGLRSPEVRGRDPYWRLAGYVAAGSVPAGLAGLALEDAAERALRDPLLIGSMMVLFSFVMLAADRLGQRTRPVTDVVWADALMVGCAQAIALVPGVSRSGATIAAGLARGLTRPAAARFSFLLSGPVILAAAAWKLRHGVPVDDLAVFAVGAAASALVGWLAVGLLLRYLQRRSLLLFVIERLVVGGATLLIASTG